MSRSFSFNERFFSAFGRGHGSGRRLISSRVWSPQPTTQQKRQVTFLLQWPVYLALSLGFGGLQQSCKKTKASESYDKNGNEGVTFFLQLHHSSLSCRGFVFISGSAVGHQTYIQTTFKYCNCIYIKVHLTSNFFFRSNKFAYYVE